MKNPKLFEGPYPNMRAPVVRSEITLLDLLAGFALAGIMSSKALMEEIGQNDKRRGAEEGAGIAAVCYGAAKRMLKEREERMKGAES